TLEHRVAQGLDRFHARDVDEDAGRTDLVRRAVERGLLDVSDDDARTLLDERLRDAAADARGTAGDDRDLAGDLGHSSSMIGYFSCAAMMRACRSRMGPTMSGCVGAY